MIERLNMRSSYKHYKTSVANPIDIKIYLYIITGFLQFLVKKLLDGFDIELSGGKSLGTIGIRGKKIEVAFDENDEPVNLAIDWGATRKMWKDNPETAINKQLVYHLNEHTNGIRYNFRWWRAGMRIGNKKLYELRLCKPNRKKLTRLIKDEHKEYLVTPNF